MEWRQVGSGALFAIGMLCLGFTTGGAVGGRILSRGQMGWDRLSDMLGGMMVGVLVAVVLTGAVVSRLSHRKRISIAAICMLVSVVIILLLQRTGGPSS